MIFHYKYQSFLIHVHEEIWFCQWISRKWIQFGVTIRMGHCRDRWETAVLQELPSEAEEKGSEQNWGWILGWNGLDMTSTAKWMQEKRQPCMGKAATEVPASSSVQLHIFVLCLMQFGGDIWTHRSVALPAFISGWECERIAFTEKCTGLLHEGEMLPLLVLMVLIYGVVVEKLFVCIYVWRINP